MCPTLPSIVATAAKASKQKIHRSLCLKAYNMYNDGKCCAEESKAEVGSGSSQ